MGRGTVRGSNASTHRSTAPGGTHVRSIRPPLSLPLPGASLPHAVSRFFRKYATFTGRASRSEYWWAWLMLFIVYSFGLLLTLGGIALAGAIQESATIPVATDENPIATVSATVGQWFLVTSFLMTVVPTLAVTWRRLHDSNRSGASFFVACIPLLGSLILLDFLARPSKPEGARFDAPQATRA